MTTLGTPKGAQKSKKREKRPFQNQTKKTHEKNTPNEKETTQRYRKVTPTLPPT